MYGENLAALVPARPDFPCIPEWEYILHSHRWLFGGRESSAVRRLTAILPCFALGLSCLAHPAAYAADRDGGSASFVDSWFLARLERPVAGERGQDGTLPLVTGLQDVDRLALQIGVHRIESAFPRSIRTARRPDLLSVRGLDRTYKFFVPPGTDLLDAVERFGRTAGVEYAEPDYIGHGGSRFPNDPELTNQWGLDQASDVDVDAPEAWDISIGDPVIIAFLDTGIDSDHPDLEDKQVSGWDFVGNDSDPEDDHGHGANVISVGAANTDNGAGIAGACWGCRVMPLKVLNSNNAGSYSDFSDGIIWATDNGARVINLSAGGVAYSSTLQNAGRYAHDAGAILVTITHNQNTTPIYYPARFQENIAVGGTDDQDRRAVPFCGGSSPGSNYGNEIDVVAPGDLILGAQIGGGYNQRCGTSQAAPLVSGLVGIMRTLYPAVGREEARHLIQSGAEDLVGNPVEDTTGFDIYYGWGRINMDRTLRATRSTTTLRVEGKTATRVYYDTPSSVVDSYDFIRGNLGALSEDPQDGVVLGTVVCLENDSVDPDTVGDEDLGIPAPGQAFFYLGRFNTAPGAGSYGGSSANRDRCLHVADGCTASGDCSSL